MAPESHRALPAGFALAEYAIEAVLGYGGFGITYLAQDRQLGTKVAIKEYFPRSLAVRGDDWTIRPINDHDPQIRETYDWGRLQFLKEAQTLGKFKHNNIVRVLRFFEANGTAYMVMEYEVGQSLARQLKMRGGKLTEQSLLRVFVPILNGLQAVHDAGLLHRDIKPDNIYLRSDDTPMLIDFGAVGQGTQPNVGNQPVTLTPAYAALEQYPDKGQEGRYSDIYSIGATMYRCVTGEPPVGGLERFNEMRQYRPDPLIPLTQQKPEGYSEFVLHCVDWAMQIYSRNRPQSARDLQDGLMATRKTPLAAKAVQVQAEATPAPAIAGDAASAPATSSGPVDHFRLILAVMVALTLLAGVGTWLAMPAKPESARVATMEIEPTTQKKPVQQVRAVVTASSPVRMVRHLKDSYDPLNAVSFSPATDQVVAAATGGDLIVWDINSGRTRATLSNHGHTVRNLVSLGGSRIAAGDDGGKILIWDIARGEPVQRMDGHGDAILAMTRSPDLKWLVSGGRDQRVILWSLTGAKNRVLAENLGRVSALAVSPDSQQIAAGTSNGTIYLIAAKTGKVRLRIDSQAGAIEALSFAPDGTTLASAGLSNEILVWRTSSARLLRKLRNPRGRPVYSLAFSRKGQLFAGDASGMITVWDVSDGRLADKYYRHRGRVSGLVFSADGKTLASVSADKTLGLWAVF